MNKIEWDSLRIFRLDAVAQYDKLKSAVDIKAELRNLIQEDYRELHDKLQELWEKTKAEEAVATDVYLRDLYFALEIFEFFTQLGFSQWEAADNEIWSGLTFKVVPDLYYDRWSWEKEDHYQRWIPKRTWRVWMKTLWWWIYLAMVTDENGNFDKEKTREQLKIYETTSIETLLDRCGRGFRVEFYRRLIKKHHDYCLENKISGSERRASLKFVVMQSFLKSKNIDPDLCGHDSFLDDILSLYKSKRGVKNRPAKTIVESR